MSPTDHNNPQSNNVGDAGQSSEGLGRPAHGHRDIDGATAPHTQGEECGEPQHTLPTFDPTSKAGSSGYDEATRRVPIWAQVEGMRMVPIEQITLSPYRARLHPDPASLVPLVESLASAIQPIPPLVVRQRGGTFELMGGLRILEALRQSMHCTEVAVVVLQIEDDLEAAFWVIGDNCRDYDDCYWEKMRAVGTLIWAGGVRVTQRGIAQRTGWNEADISEWKYWDVMLTTSLLQAAGVDEIEHAPLLRALERKHFRALRRCASDEDRAALLRQVVFSQPTAAEQSTQGTDVSTLVHPRVHQGDWWVQVIRFGELTEAEIRAVCSRIAKELKAAYAVACEQMRPAAPEA